MHDARMRAMSDESINRMTELVLVQPAVPARISSYLCVAKKSASAGSCWRRSWQRARGIAVCVCRRAAPRERSLVNSCSPSRGCAWTEVT